MDKKEIYEHLAKIYLDASSKTSRKKKKTKVYVYPRIFKILFFVSIVFVFGLSALLFSVLHKSNSLNSEVALVLAPEALKINFNFDPAKKEIYSLNLNRLNLANYKALGFSVKKANFSDTISLRVEFTNAFKEKSEVYFSNIPHKWNEYKVNFTEFKNITDWSEMQALAFSVEEWNTKEKKGIVYIDNVRMLK